MEVKNTLKGELKRLINTLDVEKRFEDTVKVKDFFSTLISEKKFNSKDYKLTDDEEVLLDMLVYSMPLTREYKEVIKKYDADCKDYELVNEAAYNYFLGLWGLEEIGEWRKWARHTGGKEIKKMRAKLKDLKKSEVKKLEDKYENVYLEYLTSYNLDFYYNVKRHGIRDEEYYLIKDKKGYKSGVDIMFPKEMLEFEENILDEVEKEYLENLIKPFKKDVEYIGKMRDITYINNDFIEISTTNRFMRLPPFKSGLMYKGMQLNKTYSIKELGLSEE